MKNSLKLGFEVGWSQKHTSDCHTCLIESNSGRASLGTYYQRETIVESTGIKSVGTND